MARRSRWDGSHRRVHPSGFDSACRGIIVAVGFTPKGDAKSTVALSHAKLGSKDEAEKVKKVWAERLDSLAGVLR